MQLLFALAVALLSIAAFIVLPLMLVARFGRNKLLSRRGKIAWGAALFLFFPLSAYAYAVFEDREPAYVYASLLSCLALAAAVVYQMSVF